MKTFYTLFGLLLMLCGVACGLYVGIYVCLYGGIVQAIHAIQAAPLDVQGLAMGVVRVLVAGLVGTLSFMIITGIGVAFVKAGIDDEDENNYPERS